ncbi:uncharacterized protein LOC108047992 [Drosophila rhopaloa]|uniref:Uncharacterized protein LOC108047992 n=1 Tax=Drosophila rhopaloa TaxID=1041015 RepID=A0A6P4F0K1_DRORH|nr:uncharacterized protein LOC108047992 [Drosophila rhopaloa]
MRNYKRKTPKRDPAILRGAVAAMKSGISLRAASNIFGIPRSTLLLHRRNNETIIPDDPETEVDINDVEIAPIGYKTVFTQEQETVLEHFLYVANDYFGLTSKQTRSLAYQYVKHINVVCPISWQRDEMAGLEWFRNFKVRHPKLTLAKPEGTNMDPMNVAEFFANYFSVVKAE